MRSTAYLSLLAGALLMGSGARGTPIRGSDHNAAASHLARRLHTAAPAVVRSEPAPVSASAAPARLSSRERSTLKRRGSTKGRRCVRKAQRTLLAPPSSTKSDDTLIGDWLDGLLPNASVSLPGVDVCVGEDCAASTKPPVAQPTQTAPAPAPVAQKPSSCFPALDFKMPSEVPGSLENWWCAPKTEYAFMGFSYDLSSCPSAKTLRTDFQRQRAEFNSRYVRLYSNCDREGFNDDLVNAAWSAGVGIWPLIWFGFDGTPEWKTRKANLIKTIKTNPKAPYVIRGVVVGSEPLFDWVLEPQKLADQVNDVKGQLSNWTSSGKDTDMQVTISEMPYGYTLHNDSPQIFGAVGVVHANILPFFDGRATSSSTAAWSIVVDGYKYLKKNGLGKKILFTQTGWPSNDDVWKANSKSAVASVDQERQYFDMLDSKCTWMKNGPEGGVGWFAHMYSDLGLPGWGILGYDMKPKFPFKPATSC